MLVVSDCENLTKWESNFNSSKSEVPEEYETIISNIESLNTTIQNVRELKIRCGNEYCCVNTESFRIRRYLFEKFNFRPHL